MNIHTFYHQLEQRLADWAAAHPGALALIVIGSRARAEHPADEWSDLDTILFTADPDRFTPGLPWQDEIEALIGAPVWFAAHSVTSRGDRESEWVLEGGLKLDMMFMRSEVPEDRATLQALIESAPYRNVFASGLRMLYERHPAALHLEPPPPLTPPTQAEFDNRIANCLLDLTRAMKLARRGELWRGARAINEEFQGNLLTLLEWQAHLRADPASRRWRYGRFLEEWADPRALAALPAAYASATLPGVRGALHASLDLLDWLAPEVAHLAGLSFSPEAIRPAADWLRSL
jgi:aminoglycoside 6-adenylyltransferase